jgi:acyl dehydratase
MRTMRDSLAVGEYLPTLVRTAGFDQWNRFAAVNDEFVPIHMDDEAARAAGYPRAIGMGRLLWSYIHSMLRSAVGPLGSIVSVEARFSAPQLRDSTVHVGGRVARVHRRADGASVDLDITIDDGHGNVLVTGTATVGFQA